MSAALNAPIATLAEFVDGLPVYNDIPLVGLERFGSMYVGAGHHHAPDAFVQAVDQYVRLHEGNADGLSEDEAMVVDDWASTVQHRWARLDVEEACRRGEPLVLCLVDEPGSNAFPVTTLVL